MSSSGKTGRCILAAELTALIAGPAAIPPPIAVALEHSKSGNSAAHERPTGCLYRVRSHTPWRPFAGMVVRPVAVRQTAHRPASFRYCTLS